MRPVQVFSPGASSDTKILHQNPSYCTCCQGAAAACHSLSKGQPCAVTPPGPVCTPFGTCTLLHPYKVAPLQAPHTLSPTARPQPGSARRRTQLCNLLTPMKHAQILHDRRQKAQVDAMHASWSWTRFPAPPSERYDKGTQVPRMCSTHSLLLEQQLLLKPSTHPLAINHHTRLRQHSRPCSL